MHGVVCKMTAVTSILLIPPPPPTEVDDRDINVVAVLVGGDYRSLEMICLRMNAGTPTVICGGTGLAADLLLLAKTVMEKTETT